MLPYDESAPLDDNFNLANNRHSIDLSIDLEHQLNLESVPSTPADPHFSHKDARLAPNELKRESLDPHILASIIMQLRQSLGAVTKERDALLDVAASAQAKEAQLTDALQLMTDKCTQIEEELSEARKKTRDDEEAITMLRSKVEESRRGLMRLQTESRRQSAFLPSPSPTPVANKRASFTPLTLSAAGNSSLPFSTRANTHRRISSVSDSGSPQSQNFSFNESDTSASRFLSGIMPRGSPPRMEHHLSAPDVFSSPELESLRAELKSLKTELEEARLELSEATEARDASEICVRALREFIADNNVGTTSQTENLKLPPLPASSTSEEKTTPTPGGWGFKLWNKASLTPTPQSLSTPRIAAAAPPPQAPVLSPDAPSLSRKLGGFFSVRTAGAPANTAPVASPESELGGLQSGCVSPPPRSQRNSGSSTSSAAESPVEPVTPASHSETGVVLRVSTDMGMKREALRVEVPPMHESVGIAS